MLSAMDLDFLQIFKVKAEFDHETQITEATIGKYASFIKHVCVAEGLRPVEKRYVFTHISC
jgi:hypothetical protein